MATVWCVPMKSVVSLSASVARDAAQESCFACGLEPIRTAFSWGEVLGDDWSQKSFAVSWTLVLVLVPGPFGHTN